MSNRYTAVGLETEHEPGSRSRVLRNRLGVMSVREMARLESRALLNATQRLIDETSGDQRLTADHVCAMHKLWLGGIYAWAGEYRSVNIAKGDFQFAAAHLVPRLMQGLERGPLRDYTPCNTHAIQDQEEALAVVHAELVLIHPFREGNGRCARIVSTLMALQADLPPLDFSGIQGIEKQRYIAAIHAALGRNYEPMKLVFRKVIARSLRAYARERK